MNKLVSVIIATYNAGKTIDRAILSILKQTYQPVEIIIVDGLSSDNTIDIIKNMKVSNIKYISEKDKGIYDALNKGVKMASGEWIYVLGSDDELLEKGISILMEHTNGYDVVYGDVIIRNSEGKKHLFKSKPAKSLPYAMCASHQAILMKRECIIKMCGFNIDYKISADYDLLLRSYLNGFKFLQTHIPIAYFSSDDGASSKLNWYVIHEQYRIYKNNNANVIPAFVVFWNFAKRIIRKFIDTKQRVQ